MNKVVGLLAIIAGLIMFINSEFVLGNIIIKLEGAQRYLYTFPEILFGIYSFYYGYKNNN